MSSSAHVAVQKRYARCPIASPKAKYSNSASIVTNPTASATIAVDPHSTIPTTNGINTTAVATRFQVIEMESPQKSRPSSHHIEPNKSRRVGQTFLSVLLLQSPETPARSTLEETDTVSVRVLPIHLSSAPGLV